VGADEVRGEGGFFVGFFDEGFEDGGAVGDTSCDLLWSELGNGRMGNWMREGKRSVEVGPGRVHSESAHQESVDREWEVSETDT
jgi:hypothetical protein